ncbi:hypothetical protein [Variovorax ginsengisoli]|uniref:Uncharacterized protein n=1 Tax=Variovorax ginsengisoli TaxID=363844 RepID=A0ABT8SBG4_9BURK|nr:hypothetical protein [Variovorax ginsengisoli]MDN8616454.1 hypothetical protein [Variovorax ginsengisoli]MDO1535624.1 hypothetical protein [Variovorax ginsengisoli]
MALDDKLTDLHKLHAAGQEKYTYFVLAASGASIAFAVQKTEGLPLSWWLVPAGLAVLSWAASFWLGVRAIDRVQATVVANHALLQLQQGTHPTQPDHPQLVQAAKEGVLQAMTVNSYQANTAYVWQFRMLLAGAAFFVAWRALEMYRITPAS